MHTNCNPFRHKSRSTLLPRPLEIPSLRAMGWQSYALAYDTDAQLEKLLDICRLHNSWGGGPTNEFFRYREHEACEQIQTGEELEGPVVAKMKNPYKTARNGPALQNVLLAPIAWLHYLNFPSCRHHSRVSFRAGFWR